VAASTIEPGAAAGQVRSASAFLYRHRWVKLGLILLAPLGWMVIVYLLSLVALLVTSVWHLDPFSREVVKGVSFTNFRTIFTDPVYRIVAVRTFGIALGVTVADIALAFPIAYYMARLATPRGRTALLVAVTIPLWASYLLRAFAWKLITAPNGILDWLVHGLRLGHLQLGPSNWTVWLTFVYLWLPFVVLPIYAALERVPSSYLEASNDLGARGWTTFRRVVWPLALPGVVAGSIFSFSLTLGDYVAPTLVGNTQFIGNIIYQNVGVATNIPFAAAYALVPIAIIAVYLVIARRMGAFEAP
jgi:putative spermidine/putrescine transport system permease protein